MNKKIVILQSNYIPWKGYFDIINMVDEFIILDTVQYTRRDWRNRNKIKTPNGLQWLTIPVEIKGKYFQSIRDTKISENSWAARHWKTILYNYSKAPFFKQYKEPFEELYSKISSRYLSEINYNFICLINKILEIKTQIRWSDEFTISEEKTQRLLDICNATGATHYYSGPAAREYFDEKLALEQNIKVHWMDYSNYPEYSQLYPPFEHNVSILDLIFNEGPNATKFMKSFVKK